MLEMVGQTAQAAVGLCFGYAAISKLVWFRSFETAVARFDVVFPALVRPAALTVVASELLVALSLLANQLRLWGAVFAGILLVIFSTVILSSRRRGIVAACMCFGRDAQPSTSKTFARIGFLGVGVAIVVCDALMGASAGWVHAWTTIIPAACVVLTCAILAETPEVLAVAASRSPGFSLYRQRQERT